MEPKLELIIGKWMCSCALAIDRDVKEKMEIMSLVSEIKMKRLFDKDKKLSKVPQLKVIIIIIIIIIVNNNNNIIIIIIIIIRRRVYMSRRMLILFILILK